MQLIVFFKSGRYASIECDDFKITNCNDSELILYRKGETRSDLDFPDIIGRFNYNDIAGYFIEANREAV